MNWESFALSLVDQANHFYASTFSDLRLFAVFSFIVLLNFTPLGALRSALVVSGTTLLLSLYGLIVITATHPLVGFVIGCNSMLIGLWGIYQLQKKLA